MRASEEARRRAPEVQPTQRIAFARNQTGHNMTHTSITRGPSRGASMSLARTRR